MKKYKNVIIYTLIFVLFMAFSIYGYNYLKKQYPFDENEKNYAEQILTKAIDFKIRDVNGNETKLSNYFGNPIVVNFWDIGCGPCLMELPAFNNAYIKYGDKIKFLMVNLIDPNKSNIEPIKNFISEKGYKFPVYFDIDYNASISYSIYSIPRTIFIDEEGNLTYSQIGMMSEEKLTEYIENLIK